MDSTKETTDVLRTNLVSGLKVITKKILAVISQPEIIQRTKSNQIQIRVFVSLSLVMILLL